MQSLKDQSPHGAYLDYLNQGVLAYQLDRKTGQAVFFPRVIAPGSGGEDLEWRVSAGLGVVYSTTVVHARGEAPYNVALIDMDEGFRLMSTVLDIDPAAVRIGLRVSASVRRDEAGQPYPVFHPTHQSDGEGAAA